MHHPLCLLPDALNEHNEPNDLNDPNDVNELAILREGEMECLGNQDALPSQTTDHRVNPCLKHPLLFTGHYSPLIIHRSLSPFANAPNELNADNAPNHPNEHNDPNDHNKLNRFTQLNPKP
jgi:hypothetical protein